MEIDFSTFDTFLADTVGVAIGQQECWDYVNLLWTHEGSRYWTYPPSDPSATNHGVKWGWINVEARYANTLTNTIVQVVNLTDVKRGDCVVISDGEYGHAGFASEDYNGTNFLGVYSQNYNNRRFVGYDVINMANFLGAFRYVPWQTGDESKHRFPWFIYNRRLNNRRNGLMI